MDMWGDVMRYEKTEKLLQTAAVLLCTGIYFKNAAGVMAAVKQALLLCYNVVIPSLFVFMVICSVVSCLECSSLLAVPFMPFFRLLHIENRRVAACCVLAVLGGFATGGIMLDRIRNEYNCDKNTLGILSILMTGNSPSFVILAVGVHYLENIRSGVILYLSVLLSACITAFFMSFIYTPQHISATKEHLVITNNIVDSIRSSTAAILNICGVVTITFSLCKVFSLYTDNSFILLILSAFTEVTTACETVYIHFGRNIYLLLLTLTVLPVSAYLQIKSIGNNSTFSLKMVIIYKLLQLHLSVLILRTLLNLFPQVLNVYANGDISVNAYWNKPHISLCFLAVCLCFAIVSSKKSEVFTKGQK